MPCHVDLQANRMLPHAASSSRATNLFHFLKASKPRLAGLCWPLAAGCWLLQLLAVLCCYAGVKIVWAAVPSTSTAVSSNSSSNSK